MKPAQATLSDAFIVGKPNVGCKFGELDGLQPTSNLVGEKLIKTCRILGNETLKQLVFDRGIRHMKIGPFIKGVVEWATVLPSPRARL